MAKRWKDVALNLRKRVGREVFAGAMSAPARRILHASLEVVLRFEGIYGDVSARPGREAKRTRDKGLLLRPTLEQFLARFEPTRYEDAAIGWDVEDIVGLLQLYGKVEVDDVRRRMRRVGKKKRKSEASREDVDEVLPVALLEPLFDGEWEQDGSVRRRDATRYAWSSFRFQHQLADRTRAESAEYLAELGKLLNEHIDSGAEESRAIQGAADAKTKRTAAMGLRRRADRIDETVRYCSDSEYRYWDAATETYRYLSQCFLLDDFPEQAGLKPMPGGTDSRDEQRRRDQEERRLAELVHVVRDFLPCDVKAAGSAILSEHGRRLWILAKRLDDEEHEAPLLPAILVNRSEVVPSTHGRK